MRRVPLLLIFQTCVWFVSLTLHSIGTNTVTSCHFPIRSTTKLPQHRDLLRKNTYPSNNKKKAYQSNVKRPLADSLGVNKFEHLGEGGGGGHVQCRSSWTSLNMSWVGPYGQVQVEQVGTCWRVPEQWGSSWISWTCVGYGCMVRSKVPWVMVTLSSEQKDRQTDLTENSTLP